MAAYDEADVYRDGVNVVRCRLCLRALATADNEPFVQVPGDVIDELVNAILEQRLPSEVACMRLHQAVRNERTAALERIERRDGPQRVM